MITPTARTAPTATAATAVATRLASPAAAPPLDSVLRAWARYAELCARGAPPADRLAAWGALQDARWEVRTGA